MISNPGKSNDVVMSMTATLCHHPRIWSRSSAPAALDLDQIA
jgi:hypothetical protein